MQILPPMQNKDGGNAMTEQQIKLLKELIHADHTYFEQIRAYYRTRRYEDFVSSDSRGVEIGAINGVNPRTAQALIDAAKKDSTDGVPDVKWSEEIQEEANRIISAAGRCE